MIERKEETRLPKFRKSERLESSKPRKSSLRWSKEERKKSYILTTLDIGKAYQKQNREKIETQHIFERNKQEKHIKPWTTHSHHHSRTLTSLTSVTIRFRRLVPFERRMRTVDSVISSLIGVSPRLKRLIQRLAVVEVRRSSLRSDGKGCRGEGSHRSGGNRVGNGMTNFCRSIVRLPTSSSR